MDRIQQPRSPRGVRSCRKIYNYSTYGNVAEGWKLYKEERDLVEVSDVSCLKKETALFSFYSVELPTLKSVRLVNVMFSREIKALQVNFCVALCLCKPFRYSKN